MCVRVGSGFVAIGNGCSVLLVLVKEDHHKMTKLNSKCIINTHSEVFFVMTLYHTVGLKSLGIRVGLGVLEYPCRQQRDTLCGPNGTWSRNS